jgi:hypothetical protein
MSTPRDLIKSSLRLIGVVASGETPTADQSNDALDVLNTMIKSLSIDGLMVHKVVREQFALTSGQQSRTMGTGGDFDTTRPSEVVKVTVKNGTVELPVEMITVEQWASIPIKTTQSSYPDVVYVEGTYPLETFNFYPIPLTGAYAEIHSRKPISGTLALSDTLSMPEGYEDFLKYELAKRLAPEYGRQLDPMILDTGMELKASIMRKNTKPAFMRTDAPVMGIKRRRGDFEKGF